jgi:hypothetical protein
MGWNFGGAVITFDYRTVASELEERAQLRFAGMSAEELSAKDRMDAGVLALGDLGIAVNAADAPTDYESATSREYDDYACTVENGRTVLLGRALGLSQTDEDLRAAASATSARRGEVLLFWLNDASGTYQFSVFRAGHRVRCWSQGEGMHDDEGEPLEVEAGHRHGADRVFAVMKQAVNGAQLEHAGFEKLVAV